MSTVDNDNEQVLSEENWGPFLPWRAVKAIRKLVKGNAQHLAMCLACKTPRSGELKVTHRELVAETGRHKDAVAHAMAECVKAGLFHQRRIMGGFKYVWGRVAYFPDDVGADVGRHGQILCSDSGGSYRDALRRTLVPCYLSKLHGKYGIRPESPEALKRIGLSAEQHENIIKNLEYGGTSLKITPEAITERALLKYMESDGNKEFLKRTRHPLSRFADDVGLIVCNMISWDEHKQRRGLTEQTHTVNRVEHNVALRPDVRQTNIEGGATLLAAMGVKRPLQRLDFKAAANG